MQRILVVCGAGASSTFLVFWMRKAAASRGLELVIDAGSQDDLAARLPGLHAVLVGAHLADSFPQLCERAAAAGVPAALLPSLAFDAVGAAEALVLLENLLTTSETEGAALSDSHDAGSPRG
ncbi:MAG: PTS IIB subunit [Lacisediminihabitans sp.]